MKEKNKTLLIVLGVLLVVGIGVSFAYFAVGITIGGEGANTNLGTGTLPLVQYDAGDSKLLKENLMPKDIITKSFKVTVTPTKDIKEVTYRIYIDITNNTFERCTEGNYEEITNECEINAEELIYRLKDSSGNVIKIGDLTGRTGQIELTRETKIQESKTEYNYTIEIEYKDTNKDQNHNANKTFNGNIKVEYAEKVKTINEVIATLNAKTEQPDFSQTATTDEGVYAVSDGMYGGTSYYWRGAATTNYLKFGGYCWRIIRINGDKTIRLIYDGTTCHQNGEITEDSIAVSNVAYNTLANRSEYVGWTYVEGKQRPEEGDTAIDSNAKVQTENWYNAHLTNYSDKIADGKYCNDRNMQNGETWSTTGSEVFAYAASERLFQDYRPALSCDSRDVYLLKVATITSDEAALAGGTGNSNVEYYLYNGQEYCVMSPLHWNGTHSFTGKIYANGINSVTYVHGTLGLRPVINLKSDVLLTGEGTINNPYQVIY